MPSHVNSENLQLGDPRLIVRWAQRYAKNRTISFLVQWAVIVSIISIIGVASALTNVARQQESKGLFYISVGAIALAIVALTWFSVSKWGSDLIWRTTRWLYGKEGYVAYLGDREDRPTPWWITALGGGLVVYHLFGALLVSFRILRLEHMQPYSALYMVPFLILMILYQRLGFWAWIWPLLYGLHGMLLLAGAPIGFRGQWQLLNMVVPVFGYGLVAILIGHAYSRFALLKLKRLTRTGLSDEGGEEAGDEDGAPGEGDAR